MGGFRGEERDNHRGRQTQNTVNTVNKNENIQNTKLTVKKSQRKLERK